MDLFCGLIVYDESTGISLWCVVFQRPSLTSKRDGGFAHGAGQACGRRASLGKGGPCQTSPPPIPQLPPLLVVLGDALTFEGEYQEARAVFQRCLELVPEHATALRGACRLGQLIVDYSLGQHEKAHKGVLELLQGPPLFPQDRLKARRLLLSTLLGMRRLGEA